MIIFLPSAPLPPCVATGFFIWGRENRPAAPRYARINCCSLRGDSPWPVRILSRTASHTASVDG